MKGSGRKRLVAKTRLLEAFSASGLRSIRYAKEIRGLDEIIANDISQKAVETIRRNVGINGVDDTVTPSLNGRDRGNHFYRPSRSDSVFC